MTETLNELKRKLGYNNVEMSYGDIKYNTFQSWQVNGQIIDLKISYGDKSKREIFFPKLKFEARPFSNKIKFYPVESPIYKTTEKGKLVEYSINSSDLEKMNLSMKLDIDFSDMLEYMRTPNTTKPAYVFISKLDVTSPKFEVFDRTANLRMLDVDGFEVGYLTNSEELANTFVFKSHVDNIVTSEEYIDKVGYSDELRSSYKKYGIGNIHVDFTFKKSPSKDQLEFLAKHKDKGVVPVFDLVTITLDNVNFKTSSYDFKMEGVLEKMPYSVFPDAKVKMYVDDIDAMLDTHLAVMEDSYNRAKIENPFLPLPELGKSKSQKFKDYLKSLTKHTDGYYVLEVNKSKDEEMKVGNKSVLEFTTELQSIIFSTEQPKKSK